MTFDDARLVHKLRRPLWREKNITEGTHFHVYVSPKWDNSVEMKKSIEQHIARTKAWAGDEIGTAVSFADGAAIQGTVSVAASVRLAAKSGQQRSYSETPDIGWNPGDHSGEFDTQGRTEVIVKIEHPPTDKAAVSAALLTALDSSSSVPEYPEWIQDANIAIRGFLSRIGFG